MPPSPTPRSDRIHVLIVDDHPAIGKTLTRIIGNEMDMAVVATVGTGEQALDVLERKPVDVAIVDLSLPDVNGLELIRRLHKRYPTTPALVFSRRDEKIYGEQALLAGARGYVMKTAPTRKIITAVRTVDEGDIYISRELETRGLHNLAEHSDTTSGVAELSDREQAVFEGLGRGKTLSEIADQLDIALKTAEFHRRQVKEKLGLETTGELLQHALAWFHEKREDS